MTDIDFITFANVIFNCNSVILQYEIIDYNCALFNTSSTL